MKTKENGIELCKCNNCERILIDENPQTNAKKYDIKGIKVHSMEYINDYENSFWACPHCQTDAYLTDL
jgi:hypothetical protein